MGAPNNNKNNAEGSGKNSDIPSLAEMRPIVGRIIENAGADDSIGARGNIEIPFSRYFRGTNRQKAKGYIALPVIIFIVIVLLYNFTHIPFFLIFASFILAFSCLSFFYGVYLFFKKDETAVADATLAETIKRRRFAIVTALSITQIICVAVLAAILYSIAGETGGEFIALLLFITCVPFLVGISLFAVVYVPVTLKKYRPKGRLLVLSVLSLIISIAILIYGGLILYFTMASFIGLGRDAGKHTIYTEPSDQQIANDTKQTEISKEDALKMIEECQIKRLYYTDQSKTIELSAGVTIPAAESSTTGIVVRYENGKPSNMYIADRHIAELVALAREVQYRCGTLFWHDGAYEKYEDGKWYFNNEVVNDVSSWQTKEKALSLLAECKVDFFIGTNGDLSSFDPTTKDWLERTAQMPSGVQIVENAPKTYVFASMPLTAELQDAAREARQSCSGERTLYVRIDKLIEIQNPDGSWGTTTLGLSL